MKTALPFRRLLGALPWALLLGSCTLRETRHEEAARLEPQIRVRAVEEAYLGSLNVLPLHQPSDVDLPRRNQLIEGYVNKNLPLKMRLLLNAYNPNLEETTLTGIDYTVLVDGKLLGSGKLAQAVDLPAHDSVRVPLDFEMNTYKLLGDDALPKLRNFALGFGDPVRQRLTLRVRPIVRASRGRLSVLISRRPPMQEAVVSRERRASTTSN
ncbi:LEA type 2 family protein [Hymenobacter sp. RP-2-7]|uniref:LEA type 2 family protein n=1 Tax=Hymenobacter polaris TaxID=2682546 RepID=A0A7Y0AE43_9BACT|nr:LEA type 2 family protein [Hymenobacter polaris]NML65522.1 LEA type 2 family protein [Hymenobacter polaris]